MLNIQILLFVLPLIVYEARGAGTSISLSAQRGRRGGSLTRRAPGPSQLDDFADLSYSTNVTLSGETYEVQIDTGSSDLWVVPLNNVSVPDSIDTGAQASVSYAIGNVSGPIKTAELVFAGYTVPNQSFIQVAPGQNATSIPSQNGLIGLGPNAGSQIEEALGTAAGYGALDNIFLQNECAQNILTILLGRVDDPFHAFNGTLSVGEVLPGFEDILEQPRLDLSEGTHFQFLMDADSIIAPDGRVVYVTESVVTDNISKRWHKHRHGKKDDGRNVTATAVVDSGFSLSQVPRHVADAFYSSFPDAKYVNVDGVGYVWVLPCTQEVNITFQFKGVQYPIHPLDATMDVSSLGVDNITDSRGHAACVGTFQPIAFDAQGEFDIILGMSFIRSAYTLVNFGDFLAGDKSNAKGDGYIQFLSTTDPAEAHRDFIAVRGM
ncbi:acid protease, partial [Hymenopellis radicata]